MLPRTPTILTSCMSKRLIITDYLLNTKELPKTRSLEIDDSIYTPAVGKKKQPMLPASQLCYLHLRIKSDELSLMVNDFCVLYMRLQFQHLDVTYPRNKTLDKTAVQPNVTPFN